MFTVSLRDSFRQFCASIVTVVQAHFEPCLIIILCLFLASVRMIWPKMQVDAISLWSLGIAAFILLVPELRIFIPYIKSVKFGQAELQLSEDIKDFGKEMESAEIERPQVASLNEISPDVMKVLEMAVKNPDAALTMLATLLDAHIKQRFLESGLALELEYRDALRYPVKALKAMVDKGIYSPSVLTSFNYFREIRNRVAHGLAFDVPDAIKQSIISIGTELLKILATKVEEVY
jgi:hypothetical protein